VKLHEKFDNGESSYNKGATKTRRLKMTPWEMQKLQEMLELQMA